MTFRATVLTLYPEMFPGPLGVSLAGRALAEGMWSLETRKIRDFATDKHRTVDDTPAGGGAGMVLRGRRAGGGGRHAVARRPGPMLAMTPRGAPLTQAACASWRRARGRSSCAAGSRASTSGFSRRAPVEPVSIGDYVLSGGELGAMVLLDACIRLLPGVMGAASSGEEESFEEGLLEYPHYTRPQEWEGRTIPEVLRSGDHAKIAAWRKQRAIEDTRLRRPDLMERHGGAREAPPSGARREDEGDKTMNLIQTLEAEAIAAAHRRQRPIPEFRPGDTLRVGVKVVEGERARVQNYEGVCIARSNKGIGLQLHRPQDQLRRRRRARLPALFAEHRFDRGRPPRRRPPRQALLSARPHRQIGPHRRAPRHRARQGQRRAAKAKPSARLKALDMRPGLPTWRVRPLSFSTEGIDRCHRAIGSWWSARPAMSGARS